ncbi:MAG: hypothetical protein ACRCV9_05565, partial [Burkholderiaceae bacterium]
MSAMQRVGNYWHMLPEYEQARKSVWNAINPHSGKRRIDEAFPPAIRKRTNDAQMLVEFVNGATWQLVGSDNYNSLVGSPPIGVSASEWALADPAAWGYLSPILRENKGWAVFITTPRGKNHAFDMFNGFGNDPDWHVERLTVSDTKALDQQEVEAVKREYHATYGTEAGEALFQQEYMCSFDAAVLGAYYAGELQRAENERRITAVPIDPMMQVHTAWDLGIADSTAIWFFQAGAQLRIVDYYEMSGRSLEQIAADLRVKGYNYGRHILPHDVEVRELGTGKTRREMLEGLGVRGIEIAPKLSVEDGIQAVRLTLPRCVFDRQKCARGIEMLKNYRMRVDEKRRIGLGPLHDFASHGADAFRYLAVSGNQGTMAAPKIVYRNFRTA